MIQAAAISTGLHALLSGDATLGALIADYSPTGSGGVVPAVFRGLEVPGNATFTRSTTGATPWPYVLIGPLTSAVRAQIEGDAWEVELSIVCYFDSNVGDSIKVERAADRVAELLSDDPIALTVTGHHVGMLDALPPLAVEGANDQVVARSVAVSLLIEKE